MRRSVLGGLLAALLAGLTACAPGAPEQPTEIPTQMPTEVPSLTVEETTAPILFDPPASPDALVRVTDHLPNIRQSLPYATGKNFTGQRIYDFTDAYLRYGTLCKLAKVSEKLAGQGLGLMIWDAFRPVSAQWRLWEVCPDNDFVANPNTHFSSHSRGNTLDVTLVDENGKELEMPTAFDDFSPKADRDYSDCTASAAANALLLQEAMEEAGFSGYFAEWWHYADREDYPVAEDFEPQTPSKYRADCQEFISLRAAPDTAAETLARIPAGEEFTRLATQGDFSLVIYQNFQGYVLTSYTHPVEN